DRSRGTEAVSILTRRGGGVQEWVVASAVRSLIKRTWRTVAFLPLRLGFALGGEASARDARRQLQPRLDVPRPERVSEGEVLSVPPPRLFRSILYHGVRTHGLGTRLVAEVLSRIYRGEPALEINCGEVGPGLMMMHGFATIVTARYIGTDCQIAQQVTIGF